MTLTNCFLVVTATSSNVYEVYGGFVTTGVEAHYPWTNRWAGVWLTCGERASSSVRSVAACMQLYSSRRKRRGRGRDADSVPKWDRLSSPCLMRLRHHYIIRELVSYTRTRISIPARWSLKVEKKVEYTRRTWIHHRRQKGSESGPSFSTWSSLKRLSEECPTINS